MKKFLIKTLAFSFVFLICLIVFWSLVCSTRSVTLKLPNNENIVFLGNSHIECAINDSIVKNSFNFARSAERMEFVYNKLKLLKRYNSQLDTVIIGYDDGLMNNLNSNTFDAKLYHYYFYDTYTFEDLKNIIFKGTFEYIEPHFCQPFNWLKLVDISKSFYSSNISTADMDNLGGYLFLERDKLTEALNRQNKKHITLSKIEYDNVSIYFLNKIIDFSNLNNITVIFIHTPMHNKLNDDNYYNKYYLENYSNIKFYDFRNMHFPDSCFGDLDHLNYKGAKAFSEYLEKEVLHKNNYIKRQ